MLWRQCALLFPAAVAIAAQTPPPASPPPASQNPSPMRELSRAHERLVQKTLAGTIRSVAGPGGKAIEMFIPERRNIRETFDVVVHFHGAAWIANQALAAHDKRAVAAVLNLGTGSGVYDRTFSDPSVFDSLLATIEREVASATGIPARAGQVTLVGFSAGHGAIRAILREPRLFERVAAVLLLDGMHTSYVPERRVMADGGTIDTTNLSAFRRFAELAMRGEKRFLVTHTEIFPGTFASTTETADWLVEALGVRRRPVLRWGPRGTQQLSEVRAGRFEIMGFAGNTAPDHVDLLHAMPELLSRLLR